MTVTEVTQAVKSKLEDGEFKNIQVSGEISNFSKYASGHMYFKLKDEQCTLNAVMFRGRNQYLDFRPENGSKVSAVGDITVYEARGEYQLIVNRMEPDGLGELHIAYEKLKRRLAEEGIFSEEHKKSLPSMPESIGLITSGNGAAVEDMKRILGARFPIAKVTVFPSLVQGEQAPASICRAIRYADSKGLDLLICGRGGGSFEDLIAFSDEKVVRCVYSCKTPIISAVGHETDFALSDFSADVRASTPSRAAELAVPDRNELMRYLDSLGQTLDMRIYSKIDDLGGQLELLSKRLAAASPSNRLNVISERIRSLEKRMTLQYLANIRVMESEVARFAAVIDSLSPLKTMSRGYSLVYKNGKLIDSADKLSAGDRTEIRFADGNVSAKII